MNEKPPSSRSALRRLLLVLAVVAGVVIYVYGWDVTDIDLTQTQRATRQASVARALDELLSPNIFDRDRETQTVTVQFLNGCPEGEAAPSEPAASTSGEPYVILSATCGNAGDEVTVEGFNFRPNTRAALRLVRASGQRQPIDIVDNDADEFRTETDGHFVVEMVLPTVRGGEGSTFPVAIVTSWPVGELRLSKTVHDPNSDDVLDLMVETVLLALMATTLAVPPSVVVSFFAAHNLMRDIRVPVGNLLLGFALLPVGWALGALALGAVGKFGFDLGSGAVFNTAPAMLVIGLVFASRAFGRVRANGLAERLRRIAVTLAVAAALMFLLGLLGGLSNVGGEGLVNAGKSLKAGQLQGVSEALQNAAGVLVGALGSFISTVSILIAFSLPLVGGLLGVYLVSATGVRVAAPVLRALTKGEAHVTGGVLGLISGAILLALLAWLGAQAALLALLTPTIAALLSGGVATALYGHLSAGEKARQSARTVVWVIGAVTAFVVTFLYLDVGAFIIDGEAPPPDIWLSLASYSVTLHMAKAGLIGAALGGVGGALAGTQAAFPVGDAIYNTTRTILNALRSIEPLIMGLVFVTWVGIGPFAGVLALTLHSIASLGKLYSEQIESIDSGPIEAIQATGATRLQTIIYAVLPQIIPPYIAFTMYRWDINVRMSTIIGFVGGGGIGFLLKQQIDLLQYREAGVAVLAIAVVVSVLDYASAWIRERLI